MTHRPNVITHTQEYTVLPGVVRHTLIIFALFTTPNLCPPPDTKSWRRHCLHVCSYRLTNAIKLSWKPMLGKGVC